MYNKGRSSYNYNFQMIYYIVSMTGYTSIKNDVIARLDANMPEIRRRFGIETLGIFGSVSRGDDGPDSDIDIFYTFQSGKINYATYLDLCDYLENLLGHTIEMAALDSMPERFRKAIEPDMRIAGIVAESA